MYKVLLVDDDKNTLNGMVRSLRKLRSRVQLVLAHSTDEALDCLKKNNIDLIVSDILMPGKSGLELLAEVKANDAFKSIPVVMVTGRIDAQAKITALKAGALDLLTKPLDGTELFVRIENCIQLIGYQNQISQQKISLEAEINDRTRYAHLVSEVSRALAEEVRLNYLLQRCCQAVVDNMDAAFARIWVLDDTQDQLELAASAGIYTHINGKHQYIPVGQYKIGQIAQDKTPCLTNEVIKDPDFSDQEWAKKEKIVAFAGHPLISHGRLVGVLGMFSRTILKQNALESLASVADGIAIGIVQKKSDDQAHFYSLYDTLTQLPNRKFFFVFLGKMISHANRHLKRFSLLLVDIDNFNRINESLGHVIGDRCLKIISQRLLKILRESDCLAKLDSDSPPIARLGGDEFAILLQDTVDIEKVHQVIKRILQALTESIQIEERELRLSGSIGISVYPDDGNSILEFFKNAETALNHAKNRGKNGFCFYSQSMNEKSLEVLDLEIELRQAIDKKQFCLYYQPKVDLKTNTIVGAEALIRWQKSNGEIVSPDRFIPLAEKTGLILPISDWVLESACNQILSWQMAGVPKVPIAVNISAKQLGKKDFAAKIIHLIENKDISPGLLELEITETAVMSNPETAISDLKRLQKYGLKIYLDDFGTGYSSLGYLQKLPVNQLKIDRSFIKDMLSRPNDSVLVKTIISMAHSMGLKIVAEGVDDVHQMEYLMALDCDVIQGYLFSPPVPAEVFSTFLDDSFSFECSRQLLMISDSLSTDDRSAAPYYISIKWQEAFCIGEQTIDGQHHRWFEILHQTQQRLLGNFKSVVGDIGSDVLREMLDYTNYHFSYEEAFMKKIGYPGLAEHKNCHAGLVQSLNQLNNEFDSGKKILSSGLIRLMENWFVTHILIEDQKFKHYVNQSGDIIINRAGREV